MSRKKIVLAIAMFLLGVGVVAWGVTDSDCRSHSEDVLICVGTGTGRIAAAVGGVFIGSGVTLGVLSVRRDRSGVLDVSKVL